MNLSCGVYNTPAAGVGEKYYEIYILWFYFGISVSQEGRGKTL